MSVSEIDDAVTYEEMVAEFVPPISYTPSYPELSDRALLEAIFDSQIRVETAVMKALESVTPAMEALSKGGIMGLMRSMQ